MRKVENLPAAAKPTRKAISVPKRPRRRRTAAPEHLEARDLARLIRKAQRLPAVRKDLVRRVKAEIATGAYETEGKLDVAIERMLRELLED